MRKPLVPGWKTCSSSVSRRFAPGRARGCLPQPQVLYYIRFVHLEWDPRQAAANLRKHGVSFEEARTAFDDELGAYYPDSLVDRPYQLDGVSHRIHGVPTYVCPHCGESFIGPEGATYVDRKLGTACTRSRRNEGNLVYTKGALRRFAGEDWFYLFVSAKRSLEE